MQFIPQTCQEVLTLITRQSKQSYINNLQIGKTTQSQNNYFEAHIATTYLTARFKQTLNPLTEDSSGLVGDTLATFLDFQKNIDLYQHQCLRHFLELSFSPESRQFANLSPVIEEPALNAKLYVFRNEKALTIKSFFSRENIKPSINTTHTSLEL